MDKADLDARVPAVVVTPSRKKVAILGFTPSFKLAPFDDPEWEVWGLNELYMFVPRWDRWFEIHQREVYEADKKRISEHLERLKAMTCPIYMQQHWDDIPGSVPYPLQVVIQEFGDYLTNTISYMIAVALLEKRLGVNDWQEIGIYGVDMAHDCLAPEMRVLTADLRWVRAGDLQVGQELLAFDEEPPVHANTGHPAQFRKFRKTHVRSLSWIKRPSHELTMTDGTKLATSVGHKWLTLGGIKNIRLWRETNGLQAKDVYPRHASRIVKLMEVWDENRSWDAGYIAAAFDGEGHISQGKRDNCQSSYMAIGFSQKLNGMSAEVERALVAANIAYRSYPSPQEVFKYQIAGGRAELLQFLGSVRPRRLMERFNPDQVGTLNSIDDVAVLRNEAIGEREVVGITTDTGTLIVEGYASHNSEYNSQRPSCEYFVGLARGMGIKVTIPPSADLMKANYLYGWETEEESAFAAKLRAQRQELQQRLSQMDTQIEQLKEGRAQNWGALQQLDHIIKIWAPPVRDYKVQG